MAGKIKLTQQAIGECFRTLQKPLTKAEVVAWVKEHLPPDVFNPSTTQAQLYRSCANVPSVQEYDAPKILIFDRKTRRYLLSVGTSFQLVEEVSSDETGVEDTASESTFALEAHLRDYLARNLHILESGLSLYCAEPTSVEYSIGGRFIDILAKDRNGIPVVIELKLNKGYDRVIGQALLYQSMIATQLKTDQVRIMLVAGEVSDELKIATSRLSNIDLFEYSISMQAQRVSRASSEV